jgi:flagellar biosynthesis/type III secretory pathway protein FliH
MGDNNPSSSRQANGKTVESYKPTAYEDSAWRIVGEFINQDYFEPMQFQTATEDGLVIDPMFSNYGGLEDAKASAVRVHAPRGQQKFTPTKKRGGSEVEPTEVERLTQQHRKELEAAVAAAREQALEEGRKAAESEVAERLQTTENRYAEVLRDISTQLNESLDGIENQAVTLAVAISEKLVGAIVDINPEYILSIVRDALHLAGAAQIKKVRVSPQDLEFFNLLQLNKEFKEYDGSWVFEADDTIKAGCILESSAGEVDYDLDAAWQRIAEQVVKVR